MTRRLSASWIGTGRKAEHPPNPNFPDGVVIDGARGRAGCWLNLAYPAPEVGQWLIRCATCGASCVVTAAGRPDDPRKIRIPCKEELPS